MKTRTILSTLLAGLLVASLAAPALAGNQTRTQKQFKKVGSSTSGQGTMTQIRDRLKDGSCQQ